MDPDERKRIVENFKKQIRKNNWNYLSRHPEIRAFVRVVLYEMIKNKPPQHYDFIANLFECDNLNNLSDQVNEQLKRIKNMTRDSSWTEYDGDMLFNCNSESCCSMEPDCVPINSILKFSGIYQDKDELPPKQEEDTQSKQTFKPFY